MQVCAEMVLGSAVCEAVVEHYRSIGWEEFEVKSQRAMEMRAIFGGISGGHGEAIIVKSVKVEV